jgi:2-polyprenyl-6-methoxyphenol hydroxylase-like FAD-dependent oxidoreductase
MKDWADILIVGAGPTGLALALQAHDHGARVRVIDRRPEMFRPSRALIIHPRTLEVLRPLGVTDALLARADTTPEASVQLGQRSIDARLARFDVSDTAFPHLTFMRQMDVEVVLAQTLAQRGVEVERGAELSSATTGPGGAQATIQIASQTKTVDCGYIVGSDGPNSTLRTSAGIGWPGGPYGEEIVLADLELEPALHRGMTHAVVGKRGLLLLFALGERATWRLLATRPGGADPLPFGQPGPPVPHLELEALIHEAGLRTHITHLAWSARYRLQHRIAERFRRDRLFLAGDAAHAYSPATGQGMNTGIQDALNLGWKLACSPSSTNEQTLLDSYESERRPIIRRTLLLTHLAFWVEASSGKIPSLLRGTLAPLAAPALPFLMRRRRLVGEGICWLSQMRAPYHNSPLSIEGTPRLGRSPRLGARLPDETVTVDGVETRLHSLLAHPGAHLLLHRDADPIEHLEPGRLISMHRLMSTPGNGVLGIRPDGYVGFRCGTVDPTQVNEWLALLGLDHGP